MSDLDRSASSTDEIRTASLWDAQPVGAFEYLCDRTEAMIPILVAIYHEASEASPGHPLSAIRPELHAALYDNLRDAQSVWIDSPIRRYIDRAEPVYLNQDPNWVGTRITGSSAHDLILMLGLIALRDIASGRPAREWASWMYYSTGVGTAVASRWLELSSYARCESRSGIARWHESRADEDKRKLDTAGNSPAHAPDFSWVRCHHGMFSFTQNQRPVIRALWEVSEVGGLGLSQSYLLEVAGGEKEGRLCDLFKNERSWGLLIVKSADRKDLYKLDLGMDQ